MELGLTHEREQTVAHELERIRPELTSYLTRLLVRVAVAEELVQETALRALRAAASAPERADEVRPWLFRIATNLAIDERRRHRTWRESTMTDVRAAAEGTPAFMAEAASFRGSPEMATVAREHLAVCFSCTLGQLPPEHAAALLLKEVFGFPNEVIADILGARFAQVKNWLQAARARMNERYAATCALIRKTGVCYQCVELDEFFGGRQGNPLSGTDGSLNARLAILADLAKQPAGRWSRMLTDLLDEIP